MIIYIDSKSIDDFLSRDVNSAKGYAYEWEGEDVIHVHLSPLRHSYGIKTEVLFTKMEPTSEQCAKNKCKFILTVSQDSRNNRCHIYENHHNELVEREISFIPSKQDLYSRSEGLLEVGILEKKRVLIIGLGSFGSQIAIELSKAGVGAFAIMDFDRVELHNLARHTSSLKDLGRLKTDVIEESILGKNPYANVTKYSIDINKTTEILDKEVELSDIVICATDNNKSRWNLSKSLVRHSKIGIFGRAITRAEGGDVFIYRPGDACYCCLTGLTELPEEEITNANDPRIPQYANNPNDMVQVGLSTDIEPICNMMVKIALMELSRGMKSGISSLEEDLVYNFYIWANRREKIYSRWPSMPNAGGNRPSIMRWYGAHINKNEHCNVCAPENAILYVGETGLENVSDLTLDSE